jgi:DNA-binding response OmpR family regulator
LPKELLLRVQAILKRSYPTEKRIIELENSFIDIDKAEIHRENKIIPLTAKEYNILLKLVDNANHIVTIGTLCQTACGEMWQGYETTLMTHIRHLREKIEKNPSSGKNFSQMTFPCSFKIIAQALLFFRIFSI